MVQFGVAVEVVVGVVGEVVGIGVITTRPKEVPAGGGSGRLSMWWATARRAAVSTSGASTAIKGR